MVGSLTIRIVNKRGYLDLATLSKGVEHATPTGNQLHIISQYALTFGFRKQKP